MILAIYRDERVNEGNESILNAVYQMQSLSRVVVDEIARPGLEFLGNPLARMPPLRIPMKPAMHSNMKPATCSDLKPATVPI